jgi:hypothetical protein
LIATFSWSGMWRCHVVWNLNAIGSAVPPSADHGRGFPFRHGLKAMIPDLRSGAVCRGWNEEVTEGGEDRDEALQTSRRSKALHYPLPFSQRHMRNLRTIVQALVRPVLDVWHDLPPSRSIGAQLVGDHALRRHAQFLQQPCQQAPVVLRRDCTISSSTYPS